MNNNKTQIYKPNFGLIDFDNVIVDSTGGQTKIKKQYYLKEGKIPIIDQGQEIIAGYTNDTTEVFDGNLPVIIFGDHTLTLKYIDFPFSLGADGVKVLSVKKGFNPKFIYYYFLSQNIYSRGYCRHFKYLKEINLPLIALSEQRRIVEILDQADELRKKRAEADKLAERILPALFYKMFGDPLTNSLNLQKEKLNVIVDINPRLNKSDINDETEVTFLPMADIDEKWGIVKNSQERKFIEVKKGYTSFQNDDVLFAKITPCMQNGKAIIARELKNGIGFGSTEFHVLRAKELTTPEWIYGLVRLKVFRSLAEKNFSGTAGQQRVPEDFLKNLYVALPPLEIQKKYSNHLNSFFQWVSESNKINEKINTLFKDILHKAFSGDLTSKWREGHMKELLQEMEEQTKQLNIKEQGEIKL